jgi:HTH-type transcriptional regulator, sugar sensing transcriptional regulator
MVFNRELINKIKDFGLNSYESKLWTALLSRGVSTAGELSDISNVPRSRAYDVLESLEKKGFIIVKLGKPIKYLAVPPREVVERVKKRVADEAERKSKTLETLKNSEILDELNLLHKTGVEKIEPTEMSGSFRGRDKLYEHLGTLLKNSQKSITMSTTTTGLQRKIRSFKVDLEKAAKRGVKVRIAAQLDDVTRKLAKQLKGVELRQTNKDARFCVVDGKEMLLMLTNDQKAHESFDSGVWINTPYFVQNFERMFEREWKDLKKL